MRRMFVVGLGLVVGLLTAVPARADMVVFGDSLSDNGNFYALATQPGSPVPNAVLQSVPYLPLTGGRFTNGPVWAEQLAPKLGLDGSDYAFGFATTGNAPANGLFDPGFVPNLQKQVDLYLNGNTPRNNLPFALQGHTPTGKDLFTIWAGANDLFNYLKTLAVNPQAPTLSPLTSVNNILSAIGTLAQHGAKSFLVLNLPPLDKTPFGQSLPASAQAGLSAWTTGFNAALQAELPLLASSLKIHITQLDTANLLTMIMKNP